MVIYFSGDEISNITQVSCREIQWSLS